MRQDVLIIMSLSGTLVVVLYFVMYPLLDKFMGALWRYRFLKIALLFYLIPFSELKYRCYTILQTIFGFYGIKMDGNVPQILKRAESIIIGPDGQKVFPVIAKEVIIIVSLVASCSIMIIGIQLYQYFRVRQGLNQCIVKTQPSKRITDIFERIKQEVIVDKNIKLALLSYIEEPMVLGIWAPIIFLPESFKDWEEEELSYVIKHELIHIKNRDLIYKFIGLLVMAIHWFNPFCILLFKELSETAEICCDKQVIKGKKDDEIKKYSILLIDMATNNKKLTGRKILLSVGFAGSSAKRMKRRIKEMKKKEHINRIFIILVLVSVFYLAFTTTIFAYEPVKKIEDQNIGTNEMVDWEVFIPGCEMNREIENFSISEVVFVDENTAKTYDAAGTSPKAACSHDFVTGTVQKHVKNASGGCRVDYYDSQRCTICGYVKIGNKKYSITYDVCPH